MKRLGMLFVAISAGLVTLAFALPAGADGRSAVRRRDDRAQEVPPAGPGRLGDGGVHREPRRRRGLLHGHVGNITLPVVAAHIHPGEAGVVGPPLGVLSAAGAVDEDGRLLGMHRRGPCDRRKRHPEAAVGLLREPAHHRLPRRSDPRPARLTPGTLTHADCT